MNRSLTSYPPSKPKFRARYVASVLVALASLVPGQCIAQSPTVQSIDLDQRQDLQTVVDREKGQYLGHPTTCLLEDGKTILCVYPKGHGRGGIVYKRSSDGGKTWSDRLPTPASWATSKEVPTLHRVVDAQGKKRVIMWSGLYPARLAVSENDGHSWSELKPVGDWGGIVVMGFVEELETGPGHYLAMFHDDGRFFTKDGRKSSEFKLFKTFSRDGGLTWSEPEVVYQSSEVHLCEPGCIRSPDGKQIAVLLRENARRKRSHIIFSSDEGTTWTPPREVPLALTGDRHTGKYGPDGRLFISFRARSPKHLVAERTFETDWVGWVGSWDDLVNNQPGQYAVRLKDNKKSYDTAYPGVEVLPDGTFVTTTYGHWDAGEQPYILCVRFTLDELDRLASEVTEQGPNFVSMFDGETLDGWSISTAEAQDAWQVRNGMIEATGSKNRSYLIYERNKDIANFEMKFRYRFPSNGNSGVNVRASSDETGKRDFKAYHVDLGHVGIGKQVLGAWDFHTPGRTEHRCFRGEKLVIDEHDNSILEKIPDAVEAKDIHKAKWNEVHITAKDNHFRFSINGKPASEFTEHLPPEKRLKSGQIQLQLHDPDMIVQFKDLWIKVLD